MSSLFRISINESPYKLYCYALKYKNEKGLHLTMYLDRFDEEFSKYFFETYSADVLDFLNDVGEKP